MSLTPGDPRTQSIARQGGYARVAKHGGRAATSAARAAFLAKFEKEVDPEQQLPLAERATRARAAMSAHMTAIARRRRKAATTCKSSPSSNAQPHNESPRRKSA